MILLLGASGYIGRAFASELRWRRQSFIPLTRAAFDYSDFDLLLDYVRKTSPTFIINAAGYPEPADGRDSEAVHAEMLRANTLLPQTVAKVCLMTNTPWGHVSSGNIFAGAKVLRNGQHQVERDLGQPSLQRLFTLQPELFRGFNELDEPNCSFLRPPCTFYSGTKALAEAALSGINNCYIWRPGPVFDCEDSPRNFLSHLLCHNGDAGGITSVSHRVDFVCACLDLWQRAAPFGVYHVTNPGALMFGELTDRIRRSRRRPVVCAQPHPPVSYCILDSSKLSSRGVRMRPAWVAVNETLRAEPCRPLAVVSREP